MRVNGKPWQSVWLAEDGRRVEIIDQTRLPHEFRIETLATLEDAARAIRDMLVRGAPLIGATAAYGVCLGLQAGTGDADLERIGAALVACRPTAVNLRWAVDRMRAALLPLPAPQRLAAAYREAAAISDSDVAVNEAIGSHGLRLIQDAWQRKGGATRSGSSPIAMPAGWPPWTGARPWPPSTRHMRPAFITIYLAIRFPLTIALILLILSIFTGTILYLAPITIFSFLDAKSRKSEFDRIQKYLKNGGDPMRLIKLYRYSRCQRDAFIYALYSSEYFNLCKNEFIHLGYKWYHIIPDWILKNPKYLLSVGFWRTFLK